MRTHSIIARLLYTMPILVCITNCLQQSTLSLTLHHNVVKTKLLPSLCHIHILCFAFLCRTLLKRTECLTDNAIVDEWNMIHLSYASSYLTKHIWRIAYCFYITAHSTATYYNTCFPIPYISVSTFVSFAKCNLTSNKLHRTRPLLYHKTVQSSRHCTCLYVISLSLSASRKLKSA